MGFWTLNDGSHRRFTPFLRFLWWPVPFVLVAFFRHIALWRFLIPVMPGMALYFGWLADSVIARRGLTRGLGLAMLGMTIVPLFSADQNNALFAVIAVRTTNSSFTARDVYLDRSVTNYRAFQRMNRTLKRSDRIFLVGDVRGYYLDIPYVWGDPLNQRVIDYAQMRTPEELAQALYSLGVTHLAYNREAVHSGREAGYFTGRSVVLIEDMLARHSRLQWSVNSWSLYSLATPPNRG